MTTGVVHLVPGPTGNGDTQSVQRTVLSGVEYELRWRWNARAGAWYMDLLDAGGAMLATGRRLVVNASLWGRRVDERMPPGQLWALDTSRSPQDPGLHDIGQRVRLVYLDLSEAT